MLFLAAALHTRTLVMSWRPPELAHNALLQGMFPMQIVLATGSVGRMPGYWRGYRSTAPWSCLRVYVSRPVRRCGGVLMLAQEPSNNWDRDVAFRRGCDRDGDLLAGLWHTDSRGAEAYSFAA